LRLTAADVIHSFWIPDLNGKRDLVPGYSSSIWFEADTVGVYRGQCAEFCGLQHANMRIAVMAETRESFDRWASGQMAGRAPAQTDAVRDGERLFENGSCALCHTVRGTTASGRVGPDLTHVATRATLAAGTLVNNLGNLEAWLINAPSLKPGTQMPVMTGYTGAELRTIAAYVASLR
jgi:cytochrome c oxidase subunit II